MFYEIIPDEKPALISSEGERVSYRELYDLIQVFVHASLTRSVAFSLCRNCPESVAGYLGFLNTGVVPLLLDHKIDRALLSNLMQTYQPRYLYVPADEAEGFIGYGKIREFGGYVLLEADVPAEIALDENLALLLTTSGSTGSPKLVRLSYCNIQSNAEAIAAYLELTQDERPVTTLPMNYTYGLSVINSHFQVHAAVLMTDVSMRMKSFWDFMKKEEATSFAGVPFTYEMLKKMHFFRMDLPSLRYMTQAGGKLSPQLHRDFASWCRERGKSFIVMYGQTEATARMGYLPTEYSLEKYGSMGFAIPGGSFQLIDVDGSEIQEPEKVGELVYRGDNVSMGYAESRDDLSKGDERGGVLVTGDMAKFDEDGFYYIVGRKKRFLKIFGNRVNLDEIDRMIKDSFEGIDCASTGTDDSMKVYITSQETGQVRKWLSETTHLSESAFEVITVNEIPKNDSGKVLYTELTKGE